MKTPPESAKSVNSTAHSPSQNGPVNNSKEARKITDFILFSQREFLLNLTTDLGRGGISFSQFYLLSHLATSSCHLTMTDIARKMGHSTASATGTIDRLEKLGYAERYHAADDRRKVLVKLTAEAMELISKLHTALTDRIAEAMKEAMAYDMDTLFTNYRGEDAIAKWCDIVRTTNPLALARGFVFLKLLQRRSPLFIIRNSLPDDGPKIF
ncbi:MAG: MarR family transcriptional regulator [Candidatus Paceibacterota bacterium]|jgi:DNA-binding MarR family transcriptional regulator